MKWHPGNSCAKILNRATPATGVQSGSRPEAIHDRRARPPGGRLGQWKGTCIQDPTSSLLPSSTRWVPGHPAQGVNLREASYSGEVDGVELSDNRVVLVRLIFDRGRGNRLRTRPG